MKIHLRWPEKQLRKIEKNEELIDLGVLFYFII